MSLTQLVKELKKPSIEGITYPLWFIQKVEEMCETTEDTAKVIMPLPIALQMFNEFYLDMGDYMDSLCPIFANDTHEEVA